MTNVSSPRRTLARYAPFVAVAALLLVAIEVTMFMGDDMVARILKYAAILLCVGVGLACYVRHGRHAPHLPENRIFVGLALTALADLLLTLISTDWSIPPGIAVFCLVQIAYGSYLGFTTRWVVWVVLLFGGIVALLFYLGAVSTLTVFGGLDLVLVVTNAVRALVRPPQKVGRTFGVALVLFACCDILVGISLVATGNVAYVAHLLVWLFYLPCQVLITLCYARAVEK